MSALVYLFALIGIVGITVGVLGLFVGILGVQFYALFCALSKRDAGYGEQSSLLYARIAGFYGIVIAVLAFVVLSGLTGRTPGQ